MMTVESIRPESLKRFGDGLRIVWKDGLVTQVAWRELRSHCPCASCEDERKKPPDPFRVLSQKEIAAGVPEPVAMEPVGHYAYRIKWNDGHDTGLYAIDALRRLSKPVQDETGVR